MEVDLRQRQEAMNASPYARLLGISVEELSAGYARATLTVRQEHCGWHGGLHGGLIISLADHTWGAACNTTDGRLHVAVELNTHIIDAADVGEKLVAEARVLHAGKTTDMAEITVRDGSGKLIALATGTTVALEKMA